LCCVAGWGSNANWDLGSVIICVWWSGFGIQSSSYTTLYIEPTFKIHHLTLSALSIKYVAPFQYTPR
jgi:hypothetical protein